MVGGGLTRALGLVTWRGWWGVEPNASPRQTRIVAFFIISQE